MKPQVVPSHVAIALAGTGQAVHDAPHVATEVLLTQLPPQLWKPVRHTKPHTPPVQLASAFGGIGHVTQVAPHAALWLVATAGSIDPSWEPYLPEDDAVPA